MCRGEEEESKRKMGKVENGESGRGEEGRMGESGAGNEMVLWGNRGEKDFDHSALSLASLALIRT